MYDQQEELDNLIWNKNDEDSDKSLKQMRLTATCREVERLAEQMFKRPATLVSPLAAGGFNILYRIRFAGGVSPDVMVRLPWPSLVQFPDEKIVQEAATAKCVAEHTQVPIPQHFFHGRDPTLGPFIILQHIDHRRSMSARLTTPHDDPSVPHVLDPDISDATLEDLWGKAARCLVQLSRLSFPRIGALVEGGDDDRPGGSYYAVAGRPITHNMTDLVRLANIPRAVLPPPGQTYGTADEWYVALAEMHVAQLVFQHNDLVLSEDDCRNKFVARQVFRRLAKQGRLSTFGFADDGWSAQASNATPGSILGPAPATSGPFRLWGDDFRAGNMLLNDSDDLVAVIDWDFAYAAPAQFILDPPWWLLLDLAETWASGLDDWARTYDARLKTWLSAMVRAEGCITDQAGDDPLPVALSTYMRESWETGRFWLSYGARKSWAFDAVYWTFLDERFFGERGDHKTRVHLLTEEERAALEPFVERKMRESKDRIIVDWDPLEAR
ncbi:hypothetical protein C8A00DRAFT_10976 [Chaetomidium leptoderma]|uniref:Aminoglycoside phosphotransferase domain-containing protein n=1 Tax=Chaetomidium leptoderma TaxID=669021 RepID=A0AAN6VXC1_9PEZI|nr:hypothetical protein C8A00DRAFT_10976 [Chaetomidium leptoderma]